MGQIRDARIRAWQAAAGITEATGAQRERLDHMAQLAVELIQVIALEKSGIRDGDGGWSGCAPISSIIDELYALDRWREPERDEGRSETMAGLE